MARAVLRPVEGFEADGVTGWLGAVAAKSRAADLDRYLITTGVHELPER